MTPGVLAMCVATVGLSALVVSLLVGAGLPALDRAAERLGPAASSRMWRLVAFAPGAVAFFVLCAVFALVPCHCVAHGAHHPHFCFEHPTAWPATGVALLAGALMLRWAVAGAKAGWHAWRSHDVRRHLQSAGVMGEGGVRRVPGSVPWAVTVGFVRPRVFVTEAMDADPDARVVLEHEWAHARGRHDLWQGLASLAGALHVPGIGRAIAARLSVAHEMSADEAAGRAVGDRSRVAAALVRLAREVASAPAGALAFGSAPLDKRVRSLLSDARAGSPSRVMVGAGVAALLVGAAVAVHAPRIHHALETLFGYLG